MTGVWSKFVKENGSERCFQSVLAVDFNVLHTCEVKVGIETNLEEGGEFFLIGGEDKGGKTNYKIKIVVSVVQKGVQVMSRSIALVI